MPKATKSKTAPTLKAVASTTPVYNGVYTKAHSDLFMNRVTQEGSRAEQDAAYYRGLDNLKIVPPDLEKEGPIRDGLTADLFARVGVEFGKEFTTQLETLASKALITAPSVIKTPIESSNKEWAGKTRPRKDWYNTLIDSRRRSCSNGYPTALASGVVRKEKDKDGNWQGVCLREQDGKLVKIQGNNAGVPKTPETPEAKWDDKNLEIYMRCNFERRDIISEQIRQNPDNVPSTSLDLLKDIEISLAKWKAHIPPEWTPPHKKSKKS